MQIISPHTHSRFAQLLSSLCLSFLLCLSACSNNKTSPETQLRAWLLQMEDAVTQKDLSKIKSLISPDYQDAEGNTRQKIMLQLALLFKRHDNIALHNTITEIKTNPQSARLVIETRFSQSNAFAQLGLTDNLYQFVLLFEPSGENWLLNQVTYQPVVSP